MAGEAGKPWGNSGGAGTTHPVGLVMVYPNSCGYSYSLTTRKSVS
jgi:hypothetical protein